MCGVTGCWSHNQSYHNDNITRKMLDVIQHRGPDDSGMWHGDNVSLGHVRLSILDLSSKGHQPFFTQDKSAVIVYNGEVYNFQELRAELIQLGYSFISGSDTEVVLNAIHAWGVEKAIPRLNGMFALAYYDLKKGVLTLARDRLGIKPLYLYENAGTLVFASEIKAILQHPDVQAQPDLHALSVFVLNQRLEGDMTLFEKVKSVLPGSYIQISLSGISETVYFDSIRDLDIQRLMAESGRSDEEYREGFESRFNNSVRIHLNSDAPVSTMCSGGVDSSLITAVAKDLKPDLVSYVADVEGTISEGAKAKLVGKHLGVDVRQVDVSHKDYLSLWPKAVWHNDQPGFHTHDMPFMAVSNAVKADNIKVILTGEGADELFGGYPWQHRVWTMWNQRRIQRKFIPYNHLTRKFGSLIQKLVPRNWNELRRQPFNYDSKGYLPLTQNSVAEYTQQFTLFGEQRMLRHEQLLNKFQEIEPIEDAAFLARCVDDFYGYLQSLLQRNDRMGMAASLESRFPFLENEMLDFAMHLPRIAKFRKNSEKWIVRNMAKSCLPMKTIDAEKIGFSVPDTMWLSGLDLVNTGLTPDIFKWNRRMKSEMMLRLRENPRFVYTMVGIELWLRIFFNGEDQNELSEKLLNLHG